MIYPYSQGFPATYTPYGQQYQTNYQQGYQQTVQQPIQQQQAQIQTSTSIIWVPNEKEAAMYPVAPNNAVVLWDSSMPVIYLKQADASGKPTMKIYDLVERTQKPVEDASTSDGKDTQYATKIELASLAGVVKDFDGILATIREDVDALKAKKPSKKEEKNDG